MTTELLNPYTALPHIHDVGQMDIDAAALNLVGSPLCEHDLNNQLGACRLHKHFDIRPDEIVLGTYVCSVKTIVPSPHPGIKVGVVNKHDPISAKAIPWMMKFDKVSKEWIPIQYLRDDGENMRFVQLLRGCLERFRDPQNRDVMESIGQSLVYSGLDDNIGLSLHFLSGFTFDNKEVVLNESTDERERTQAFVQQSRETQGDFSIDTHFFYELEVDGGGKPITVTCNCYVRCCDEYGSRVHVGNAFC